MEEELEGFYVNARQHVRPRRYQRRFKKARLAQGDDQPSDLGSKESSSKEVFSVQEDQVTHHVDTSDVYMDDVHQEERFDHMDPVNIFEDEKTNGTLRENEERNGALKENDEGNCAEYQTDGLRESSLECSQENDLIHFIKHQESTLLDTLFGELDFNQYNDLRKEDDIEEEEEVTSDTEKREDAYDTPVQPGHWLTLRTSVLLIWIFAMTHSLTSSQLCDLLTLINLHLLPSNPAFESLYRFKTFFSNLEMPAKKHFYCANCYTAVDKVQHFCPNPVCNRDLRISSGKEYFLELDIISQLKNFYSRQEFEEGLKHRFSRNKEKKENIEDIYDSQQYKDLSKNDGPLSKPYNLSFVFNTDGVPIFKSSKTSIWPIFLLINELPYKMRKSRKYMILAGLWCGSAKPSMNIFLDPMCKTFNDLEKGVEVTTFSKATVLVQGFLLAISCDLPARSTVLNINQHNGEGCCIKCLQMGKNHRTETGGNIRVFDYKKDDPKGPLRTHESIIKDAEKVTNLKSTSHINGIKGPSIILFCPFVDGVKSVAIDYMHLVCLGTVRLLLKLWFNLAHSLNNFSLYRYTEIVDMRLEDIKPPHIISRKPRSISEHLKFWKASELRTWLFYYSIPCIADLLPPVFLYHYCTFVEGIFLLCRSSISASDLEKSEELLRYFVFMFSSLYAEKYLTINIHSLLHLPQTVRELGPLWAFSCFSFEDANGELLQLFHGTQNIDLQIVNAVHVFQMLPLMSQSISNTSIASDFVKKLSKIQESADVSQFRLLGRSFQKELSEELRLCIIKLANNVEFHINFHSRAVVRGVIYHSLDYKRVSKRNSYTVRYFHEKKPCYGFVKWFGEVDSRQIFCVNGLLPKSITLFNMHHENITPDEFVLKNFLGVEIPHVHFFQKSENETILPLRNILELCICVEMGDVIVVCDEPNHHERNL